MCILGDLSSAVVTTNALIYQSLPIQPANPRTFKKKKKAKIHQKELRKDTGQCTMQTSGLLFLMYKPPH